MVKMKTNVYFERDYNDSNTYYITICPGEDILKMRIETTQYLMKSTGLPYKMKKGTTQKRTYNDITEFIQGMYRTALASQIVMILLRKLLLLLHL